MIRLLLLGGIETTDAYPGLMILGAIACAAVGLWVVA